MLEQDLDHVVQDQHPITTQEEPESTISPEPPAAIGLIGALFLWLGHAFFGMCAFVAWGVFGLCVVAMSWFVCSGIGTALRDAAIRDISAVSVLSGFFLFLMAMMAHWLVLLHKYDDEARLRISMKRKVFGRQLATTLIALVALISSLIKSSFFVGVLATFITCTIGSCYAFLGGALTISIIKSTYATCIRHPFWGGVWTTLSNLCIAAFMIGLFGLSECSNAFSEMNISEYDTASLGDYLHNIDEDLSSNRFHECIDQLQTEVTLPETHRLENKKRIAQADAEDIVQDVLIRVCTAHSKEAKRELVPYFVQSVNNAATDYQTSMNRRTAFECQWMHIGRRIQDPYDPLFARIDLERALCNLDSQDQTLLAMAHHGYNTADIARELGTTQDAIRKRRSRLYKALRDAF